MAEQPQPRPFIDPALADAEAAPLVLAAQLAAPAPRRTARHSHARGQLLGANSGLLRIDAGRHHWLLPAGHVAWIPPLEPHALLSAGPFDGWSLYFSRAACDALPDAPRIFSPGALLEAAVVRLLSGPNTAPPQAQERLVGVLFDEIVASTPLPLALSQPRDRRLRRIAAALAAAPHDDRSVDAWAAGNGLSSRSLARHWQAETGMTLTQWKQRLRVLVALPRLQAGETVTQVALSLGYETPSAFIGVFKREMGVTPLQYGK